MRRRDSFIFFLCLTVSTLSLYQTFKYLFRTPGGYVFPLVHNFEQDFYWYLSLMRQGWEGNLLVTTRYTAEVFPPQPVNTFFVLLGLLARITGINLPVVYTAARVLGGAGLIFASWIAIRKLSGRKLFRFLAFLMVVVGAPLWFVRNGVLVQAGEFWTGFDPVLRVAWLPHHTAANALFMIILLSVFTGERREKTGGGAWMNRAGLFLLAFAAVWLNPATGLLIWFVAGVTVLVHRLRPKRSPDVFRDSAIALVGSGVAMLFLYMIQGTTFPWTAFADWERFNRYPIDVWGYLSVLGLPGILAIPGIWLALRKSHPAWTAVVLWYLFPFAGLVILSRILPVSNGRFLQSAAYIPAAILGALAATESVRRVKSGRTVIMAGITVFLIAVSLPSFMASIRRQDDYIKRNAANPLVYVPRTTIDGLTALSRAQQGGILVAPRDVSVLAPAFTTYRVVAGHPTFTVQAGERDAELADFYASDDTFREEFLKKYPAAAIWVPQGVPAAGLLTKLGYRQAYGNPALAIYVKK